MPTLRWTRRALAGSAAAVTALLLVQACSADSIAAKSAAAHPPAPVGKPMPTGALYGYPDPQLYGTAAQLKLGEHAAEAAAVLSIAQTPAAYWAAGQKGEMAVVRQITVAGEKTHAIPVIVAYNLPDRDSCGKYSAHRGSDVTGYQAWIDQLAAAIGGGRDIVIVEPDAVPDIVRGCLSADQDVQRYEMLRYAMRRLGALEHTFVYLDAGNPGEFADPVQLVKPLIQAGIRSGRGFSANVANFQWTGTTVQWSQRLESALGGDLGVVIDTSRNGVGPYTGPDSPQWCNPPGRSPGVYPQLSPGPAGTDAYLWVKDIGASDGPCNGGPAAGQYWAAYAEGMALMALRKRT